MNFNNSSWVDALFRVLPRSVLCDTLLFLFFSNDLDSVKAMAEVPKRLGDDPKIGQTVRSKEDRRKLQYNTGILQIGRQLGYGL